MSGLGYWGEVQCWLPVRLWILIGRNLPRMRSADVDVDLRDGFRMRVWISLMLIAILLLEDLSWRVFVLPSHFER